jgi:hypothetical protein
VFGCFSKTRWIRGVVFDDVIDEFLIGYDRAQDILPDVRRIYQLAQFCTIVFCKKEVAIFRSTQAGSLAGGFVDGSDVLSRSAIDALVVKILFGNSLNFICKVWLVALKPCHIVSHMGCKKEYLE